MLGDDITMALDFGYRWRDWHDASWVLDRVADCDIYFAEATLQHDDLHGHARLARRSPIRICGAEFAATRCEIREWIEIGKVAVVQPDISRCGGLTEIRRIAEICELYGVQVIPHGWKTGITSAVRAALPGGLPGVAPLRVHLARTSRRARCGATWSRPSRSPRRPHGLPEGPGLGIELNEEVVRRYRTDGRA